MKYSNACLCYISPAIFQAHGISLRREYELRNKNKTIRDSTINNHQWQKHASLVIGDFTDAGLGLSDEDE